jgi:serine/threonine-protein kinase
MASGDESSELPTVSGPSGPGATVPVRAVGDASEIIGALEPGVKLGDFEILQEIGHGGMGVVYKAYENALRRVVALKVLHPHIARDLPLARRFRREAVLAASLNHPNIVSVFHVDDREIPRFFSMEFVEGQSLKEKVDQDGTLRPEEAVRIALEICDALQYAHEHNIIHRDIKPGNILLQKDRGRVMITDFGIAREISEHLAEVTQTEGFTAGTPAFMSPEQNLGHRLDARTDIFSFGMTLYYMLAGRVAYEARNRQELVLAFQNQHPQAPSHFNPAVSPALDQIVLKMIATDSKYRFWSCKAVAADLQKALGSPAAGGLPAPAAESCLPPSSAASWRPAVWGYC